MRTTSLARKTALGLMGAIGLLTLLLFGTLAWMQTRSLQAAAGEHAADLAQRATAYLAYQETGLQSLAYNLAVSDRTYAFVVQGPAASSYDEEVLNDDYFYHRQDIDLLAILGPDGQPIYLFYRTNFAEPNPPEALLAALAPGGLVMTNLKTWGRFGGLLDLDFAPLSYAAQPILPSQGDGPSRGTLVVGRFQNAPRLEAVTDLLGMSLRLVRLTDPQLPAAVRAKLEAAPAENAFHSSLVHLTSYARVSQFGGPTDLVMIAEHDDFGAQGALIGLTAGGLMMLALTLAFGWLTRALIRRFILQRLNQLNVTVHHIEATNDLTARVIDRGRDEISQLAEAINRLLASQERHWAAARERERERRLQLTALEAAANGIVITDRDSRIVYANPGFTTLTGYTVAEALGQTPQLLKSGAQPPEFYAEMWQTISSGQVWHGDLVNRRKSGQLYIEDMTITPVRGDGGEVTHFVAVKLDVTERRQAETALLASEVKYRRLIEKLSDGVIMTDVAGYIIEWNPAQEQVTGVSRAAALGRPFSDLLASMLPAEALTGTQADVSRHLMHTALASGQLPATLHPGVVGLRRTDGSQRLVEVDVYSVPAAAGFMLSTITRDVTEAQHVQVELRERQERFQILFEDSPVSLWESDYSAIRARLVALRAAGVTDFDAYLQDHPAVAAECAAGIRVVNVNRATLRLFGAASAQDITAGLPVIMGGMSPAQFRAVLVAVAEGRPEVELEIGLHTLAGQRLDAFMRLSVPPMCQDTYTSVIFSVVDMTAYHQAVTALQASQAKLSALFAASPDMIVVRTEAGQVLEANPAYLNVLGITLAEARQITGFAATGRWSSAQVERLLAASRAALDTGTVQELELDAADDQGVRHTLDMRFVPLDTYGLGRTLMQLGHDVTKRKAAESAVRRLNQELEARVQQRTAQLESVNRALEVERAHLAERVLSRTADLSTANAELARAARIKDEFLASMSHELRTPLNTILGMSEILQEGLHGALTPPQAEGVHSIEESGRHLLSLINDILDLSKIEAGRMTLVPAPVMVADVCAAAVRLVRQPVQLKSQTITTTLDPAVPEIVADERRLKQMLVNLLSNAHKFTPAGGAINLTVTGDPAAQLVRFAVTDTGIGIAPEDQLRLFQPFVQIDSRLARQFEGTGLGLSLVRRMAELHGGSISLSSTVGVGSCFTIVLPWQASAAVVAAEPALAVAGGSENAPAGPAPLVLIADDNEANIKTLSTYLKANAYRVAIAHQGREAVALAAELRPDVLVLDIQMPEMDGLEAARLIRQQPAHAATPIIALTALAMPGDEARCLAAGVTAYRSKPVALKALVQLIEQLRAGQPVPETA